MAWSNSLGEGGGRGRGQGGRRRLSCGECQGYPDCSRRGGPRKQAGRRPQRSGVRRRPSALGGTAGCAACRGPEPACCGPCRPASGAVSRPPHGSTLRGSRAPSAPSAASGRRASSSSRTARNFAPFALAGRRLDPGLGRRQLLLVDVRRAALARARTATRWATP